MSQSPPTIGANKSGLDYRQEDNDGKKALLSHHKGGSAPAYAEAGCIWLDDAATPWRLKLHDGSDWIVLGDVNASNNSFTPYHGAAPAALCPFAEDSGTADAAVIAPVPAVAAYAAGMVVTLKPAAANTGAATLAVSGLAAQDIKLAGGADLPAGAMVAGGMHVLVYDGSDFILVNPALAATQLTARGSAVASAATTDIGAADSDFVEISGTTAITSLGTGDAYNHVWVKFQDALTLTHNATSLILPGAANITTAAGDTAEFVRISGGNWQCLAYHRASGQPVAAFSADMLPAGCVIDTAYGQYTANANLAATITFGDSIPQNTDGIEIISISITPKSASNKLRVTFSGFLSGNNAQYCAAALFRDSVANALHTTCTYSASVGLPMHIGFTYEFTPATTSAVTLKLRAGTSNGSAHRYNGNITDRRFGGSAAATLSVQEIKA